MTSDDPKLPRRLSTADERAAFLARATAVPVTAPRGRLIFALDATASREPTWDLACQIQGELFSAAGAIGGLEVQLVFYRGFGECKASPWVGDPAALLRRMTGVRCLGGRTQIGRVLAHALAEARARPVNAVVFVGDAMEEGIDHLCHLAGQLGLIGAPVFLFHEGDDPTARAAFTEIARLSGGACCPFDGRSADQLRAFLGAVAAFAAGGRPALDHYGAAGGAAAAAVRQLTSQVRRS